jgi:hypothetical protein
MVTTPQGDFMEKSFSVTVGGITSAILANAENLVPYLSQLVWAGFEAPVFSVAASNPLPPGLTMTEAGLITGTPTEAGTFQFVVDVQDNLSDCQQLVTLTISAFPTYTLIPPINAGGTVYFNNGASFPAGVYQIAYVTGAWSYDPTLHFYFSVNLNPQYVTLLVNYTIFDSNLPGSQAVFPAVEGPDEYSNRFLTEADAEAANNGVAFAFTHTGGPIGMAQVCSEGFQQQYPGTSVPTFLLTKIS